MAKLTKLGGKLSQDLDTLLNQKRHERHEEYGDNGHDDNEADKGSQTAGHVAVLQEVNDRCLDERDERTDGQKLDNRGQDAQNVEHGGRNDDRANQAPNANKRQPRPGKAGLGILSTSVRPRCHCLLITPSGSILS